MIKGIPNLKPSGQRHRNLLQIRSLQICKSFLQLLLQWGRKVQWLAATLVNATSHAPHINVIATWYIGSMNWLLQMSVCSLLLRAGFPQDSCLTCAEMHFGMLVFALLMQPKRQLRWNLDWLATNWCNRRDDKSWRQNWTLKNCCKKYILKSNLSQSPRQINQKQIDIEMPNHASLLSMAHCRTASSSPTCTRFQCAIRPATQQPVILCLQIFPGQWLMPESVQRSLHNLLRQCLLETSTPGTLQSIPNMSSKQDEHEKETFGCINNCQLPPPSRSALLVRFARPRVKPIRLRQNNFSAFLHVPRSRRRHGTHLRLHAELC